LVVGSEDRELPRVRELLQRGCAGIIDERARPQMVRKAVRAVAEGEFWIPRRVLADVLRDLARRCSHSSLTDREREILWLISQGLTNRAIAITKGTALGSTVAVQEILNQALSAQSIAANPSQVTVGWLLCGGVLAPMVTYSRWVERRWGWVG